jgi:hypothetical protein
MMTARFSLGKVVATPGAIEAMHASGQSPDFFLDRHVLGDWGIVGQEDWQLNDQALKDGERVLSAYQTLRGKKIWVITEADRSATTLLLPDEY